MKTQYQRPTYFFESSSDGGLYDTRVKLWHGKPPLRKVYSRHFQTITTTTELKATLRAGSYAWPGGYPLYFICADGEALAFSTVKANLRQVLEDIRNKSGEWCVVACTINYEDTELYDAHTGRKIESAYGN